MKCDACARNIPDSELGKLMTLRHKGKTYHLHESCARTVKANPDMYLY